MAAAGMKSDVLPVMSFSIGEQEAQAMGPALVEGSYAGWNYFQTVDNPENKKFVETYKAKFGADAVVTEPMVHGYIDVDRQSVVLVKSVSVRVDSGGRRIIQKKN